MDKSRVTRKKRQSFKRDNLPIAARLVLEDGSEYIGWAFGRGRSIAGEVVFNTGMNGLTDVLTDPASCGQIIVSTWPSAGNCGVPVRKSGLPVLNEQGIPVSLESEHIHAAGLIVSDLCEKVSHYSAGKTLSAWFEKEKKTGIFGIDTRALTTRLRERGTMRGKILVDGKGDVTLNSCVIPHPLNISLIEKKIYYPSDNKTGLKIILLDCGVKANIIRCLLARGVEVIRVHCYHNLEGIEYDGILLSSGPGDPKECGKIIETVRGAFEFSKPVFGIGLGNLIMALASGADTYKLPSGHRGQNQPCIESNSNRCYVTSQNHGYAVRNGTLGEEWQPWFINANDGTIEGIRCVNRPFAAVQFSPEGCPGSRDTEFLFDLFIEQVKGAK